MATQKSLPFKVGQLAEAKCFEDGFLGAWFRCKVKGIRMTERQILLEYFDFPDEEIKWTDMYQMPPKVNRKSKKARKELMVEVKTELMVRPQFPQICCEKETVDSSMISEVMVVVDGVWKVGDLVDWWKDDCFWSGTVIGIKGDDKVKIKLLEPPLGHGLTYSASRKDLRPSLDWSVEYGWSSAAFGANNNGRSCFRLIQPVKQDSFQKTIVSNAAANDEQNIKAIPSVSLVLSDSVSLPTCSMRSKNVVKQPEVTDEKEMHHTCSNESSKDLQLNETIPSNSVALSSLESTVMNLEELLSRVKWLRGLMKHEIPANTQRHAWKIV